MLAQTLFGKRQRRDDKGGKEIEIKISHNLIEFKRCREVM